MIEVRFRLDEKTDARVIKALIKQANGGPISKAAYRLFIEYFAISNGFDTFPPLSGQDEVNLPSKDEDSQADLLKQLNEEW